MTDWTTPRDWVDGEIPDEDTFNSHVRDQFLHLKEQTTLLEPLLDRNIDYLTSDLVKNADTTFENIAGLSFSIGASEIWAFILHLFLVSNAAADYKLMLTYPAGATGRWGMPINVTGGGGISAAISSQIAIGTTGSDELFLASGLVVNSTTPGTVQVQGAQLSSHASNSTVYQNSWINAVKVS